MKKNILMVIPLLVCMISLAIMIFILVFFKDQRARSEFVPPAFEVDAMSGVPEVDEDLGWSELDIQAYKVSVCGVVLEKEGKADVWFTNPKENTVWLKLRLLDKDGEVLGETGLLRPGEYVQAVTLKRIPESGEPIELKLMGYEPETYYSAGSASLSTTIRKG